MKVFALFLVSILTATCAAPQIKTESNWRNRCEWRGLKTEDSAAAVRWRAEQFPLKLHVVAILLPPNTYFDILAAAKVWNQALGFEAFVVVDVSQKLLASQGVVDEPNYVYVAGASLGPDVLAITRFSADQVEGFVKTSVVLFNTDVIFGQFAPYAAQIVAIHELGHVLGLAHQPFDSGSVMYPAAINPNAVIRAEDIAYVHSYLGRPCDG